MCRPRAVAGPLSGTGPARRRRPQTCRDAGETGPGSSCRGDRSWVGRVSVSRPIEGLDSHGAVRTLRVLCHTRTCPRAGRCQVLNVARQRLLDFEQASLRNIQDLTPLFACTQPIRSETLACRLSRPSMGRDTRLSFIHRAVAARGWTGVGRAGTSTRLRAPVTCWPGAGEWPANGARSTHRKPARGDPPFRRGSDARGAGATDPCPASR